VHVLFVIPKASKETKEEARHRVQRLIYATLSRAKVETIVIRRSVAKDHIGPAMVIQTSDNPRSSNVLNESRGNVWIIVTGSISQITPSSTT
jgi:hypothetical protein